MIHQIIPDQRSAISDQTNNNTGDDGDQLIIKRANFSGGSTCPPGSVCFIIAFIKTDKDDDKDGDGP